MSSEEPRVRLVPFHYNPHAQTLGRWQFTVSNLSMHATKMREVKAPLRECELRGFLNRSVKAGLQLQPG